MPEDCAAEALSSRLPQHSSMTQAPPSEGRGFFYPQIGLEFTKMQRFQAPLLTATAGTVKIPACECLRLSSPAFPHPLIARRPAPTGSTR